MMLYAVTGMHWMRYKGRFIQVVREREKSMLDISTGTYIICATCFTHIVVVIMIMIIIIIIIIIIVIIIIIAILIIVIMVRHH